MKRKNMFFFSPLVLTLTLLFAGISPSALYISLTSNGLNDIEMISENNGWIVGENGIILHWDGNSWKVMQSPTEESISDVDFVDANDGWMLAGGWYAQGDTTIIWRWDGSRWVDASGLVAEPPTRIDEFNYDLWMIMDISMVSSDDGWATGWWSQNRKYWSGTREVYTSEEFGLLLHWNGTKWHVSAEYGSMPRLSDVFMLDSSTGWTCTSNAWSYGENYEIHFVHNTYQYDGTSWVGIREGQWGFFEIFGINENDVWGAAPNSLESISHWNGNQWTDMSPSTYSQGFCGVHSTFFLGEDNGWAVGSAYNVPDDEKECAIFHWDGTNWERQGTFPLEMGLYRLYMLSNTNGWAIGDHGTILRWDGTTWEVYATALYPPFWTQLWFWGIIVVASVLVVTVSVVILKRRRKPPQTVS
jgi:hypothetical protein